MKYEEIRKRLNKCQVTLELLQSKGTSNKGKGDSKDVTKAIKVLKESIKKYKKLLTEGENSYLLTPKGGKPTLAKLSDDEVSALKTSDDVDKIKTASGEEIKERLVKNDGIEFNQNETGKIAVEVGKALAIALKKGGDEIETMKARRIEPNSFDIYVEYKAEGNMDEFSFHIADDVLHLVDFSFDKELVDVGVKPSGEPIVNRDVLANELLKHFKSLNEEEVNEVNYDYYTDPKHFDICPGAKALRDELIEGGKSPEELGEWTFKHDELFKLEKAVLKAKKADERHVKVAKDLAGEITHHSRDLGIEANKIGYLKGHIKIIEDIANKTDGRGDNMSLRSRDIYEAEGDDHHYLKVSRRDYKKAESILGQNIDSTYVKMEIVDNDGAGNVIFYFIFRGEYGFDYYDDPEGREVDDFYTEPDVDGGAFVYDAVMDLQAHGIEVVDHSAEMDENVEEGHGGDDLDVGHQDDEPGMLKSTSYEIATYAAKLYKKLAQYDQVDGEVDFPNWWQSKLILAKDYVSKAYHYLDSEEKQPIIDKLALEHALSEGTELYDRNGINIKRFSGGKRGLMVQVTYGGEYIQIPADEFPILARAMQSVITDLRDMNRQVPRSKNMGEASAAKIQKAHGQVVAKMKELAKQYKAGDKSVVAQLKDLTAKKKELEKHLDSAVAGIGKSQQLAEVTEDEVQDAIYELRNLIDEIEAKGEEAREVVRQVFPNELSRLDAYGAFNSMYSANRYDVTLGGFVDRLEEEGYEIEDGEVFTNENLKEWGSSDQYFMNKSIHRDLGEPAEFPGLSKILDAAGDAVDFYWDSWPEYEDDREDLIMHAARGYTRAMFPDFTRMAAKMVEPADEGKYKSDAQRKAIYATKAEKGKLKEGVFLDDIAQQMFSMDYDQLSPSEQELVQDQASKQESLKEEMDGGRLFDYFKSKGYDITERRPDGYPPKEGVEGYLVSRGSDRSPQSVIFQYNKDTDEFTISRMGGYRIDQEEAIKAGMREKGRSGVVGQDSYMTDGNYTPVSISAEGLKDIVDHVMTGLDRESEAQRDFYKDRKGSSGTIDEGATCCGRCGRVHVKGSGCKRPYLKGKSHCRNK